MTSISAETALEDLRAELGASAAVGPSERGALAVARPATTPQVQACLRWATRHRVPVVTIGSGSRLDPDVVVDGALVLSTEHLTEIVISSDGSLTAQAGARTDDVLAAAVAAGGWLPLTPGPSTTIGGDVATAPVTGLRTLDLRRYVVDLQIVLADGQVVRAAGAELGGPMALANLFAGSRGLLGVITEVTLSVPPAPEKAVALVAFAEPAVAADAALEILAAAATAEVQLLSHLALAGPTSFVPSDGAVLLVCCDPGDAGVVEEVGMAFDARQITVCRPGPDALVLLGHGSAAVPALRALGSTLRAPLAVPATRLAEFCDCTRGVEHRFGRSIVLVGDAAAGAVQAFVVGDDDLHAAECLAELLDLAGDLVQEALGTGDGRFATGWVAGALGGRRVETDRRMKKALDPRDLLNPGLAF